MLSLCLLLLLCSNAISSRRDKSILYARSGIVILIVCLSISFVNYNIEFLKDDIGLYHGLLHNSVITHTFHIFIFIVSGLILQLNSFYPRKIWTNKFSSLYDMVFNKLVYYNNFILNKMGGQFRILEYPLIMLFVILGGALLISCSDLISLFLAIELQSYGLYILCSVYKESEKATSAGLTYFLLGGLSSCFILFASSLLYGNLGNTSFDGIYIVSNISECYSDNKETVFGIVYSSNYIDAALAIMSIGFLFKVTAAPFHFWSPDVYDAIPTIVTSFVAIFAKISIFVLMLELVYYTSFYTSNIPVSYDEMYSTEQAKIGSYVNTWKYTLVLSAMASFIIGSVLGMTQFRIKRLYAYSTISHVGFILLALSINSMESIQSFIFYLMQYSLSNLNAFMILIGIGYCLYLYVDLEQDYNMLSIENSSSTKFKKVNTEKSSQNEQFNTPIISDKTNSPIQLINQLKGFFYINPALSISLAITIFSFVGIPPLIGFFGKQMVLSAALDKGYIFITLIAILTSVISAYYYLSLIKQIFFDKSEYVINEYINDLRINSDIINIYNNKLNSIALNTKNIVLSSYLTISVSILTLGILLFMISPQEWLSMINILSLILFSV